MEENTSQNIEENHQASPKISSDVEQTVQNIDGTIKKTAEQKSATKADRNSIENILRETNDKVEAKRLELFLKELNEKLKEQGINKEIKSYDELTVEQRQEYKNYKLPQEEEKALYDESKSKIITLTTDRNKELDSLGQKIDNLYNEIVSQLAKKQEALATSKPEEVEQIKSDIAKLTELRDQLGPDKNSKSEIRKDLANAFTNHDEARMNAAKGLAIVFSEERVHNDPDITDKLVPESKREEYKKEYENNKQQEQDGKEQEKQQVQKGQVDPRTAAAVQQAVKNMAGGAVPQGGVASNFVEQDAQEEAKPSTPTGMEYLVNLGYDGNTLKTKSSIELLNAFVGADEKAQLAILSDSESNSKIFEAMKKANNRWTPMTAIKFNKTRRALIKMANGPMMRKALETLGKDVDYKNLDELNDKFNSVMRDYKYVKSKKEDEIAKLPDGEEKNRLQAELDEYEKQYSAMLGVTEFRNISNKELNRFRDKVIDKMSGFFNRGELDQLNPPSAQELDAQESRDEQWTRTKKILERNRSEQDISKEDVAVENIDSQKDLESEKNENELEKSEQVTQNEMLYDAMAKAGIDPENLSQEQSEEYKEYLSNLNNGKKEEKNMNSFQEKLKNETVSKEEIAKNDAEKLQKSERKDWDTRVEKVVADRYIEGKQISEDLKRESEKVAERKFAKIKENKGKEIGE